jgi:exonuclease III
MVCEKFQETTAWSDVITTMDKLCIMSFNPTGLGFGKSEYIANLLDKYEIDILFIQESWLLQSNLQRLGEIHKDYLFHGQSGIKESELLHGRPYGGVAILWHKKLATSVVKVKDCGSNRLCAVKLKCKQRDVLLVSCYMPNDNNHKTHVSDDFLKETDALECLISRFNDCSIIVGGDMNLDYKRQNAHDLYFSRLLTQCDMLDCWSLNGARKDYTYCDYFNHTSCIDHFNISSDMGYLVKEVYPIDCALNPSNHRPIHMYMDLESEIADVPAGNTKKGSSKQPISWSNISKCHPSIAKYKQNIDTLLALSNVFDVHQCKDFMCSNADHRKQIDNHCDFLVNCCLEADHVFPRKTKGPKVFPGWSENVKDYRDDCLLWFNIWKSHGKPAEGFVYDTMRESKRQYMYAVRRTKRRVKAIRNQKMAECLKDSRDRDFFQEVKKLGSKSLTAPSINTLTSPKEITECFADKYRTLYNSVPSNPTSISAVKEGIATDITSNCHKSDVTAHDVKNAIQMLKPGKHDGERGFSSSHLLYASDSYFIHLAQLIESSIIHGYQPQCITLSTIVSIPKDYREDICCDSNYRGITLCSAIVKVFDLILLTRNKDILDTSKNQFAYKAKHGTVLCTLMLKETVNHYITNGSDVYSMFIDASKAFDRVKHDQLFNLLRDRGMNPLDLRFLIYTYEQQKMRTSWQGTFSEPFHTSNGIGQGKMASPVLFCCYLDVLLNRLEEKGIGCWMGAHYAGAISYADDLTLLSPTAKGLQTMINICEEFSKDYSMTYNPKKSVCVLFSRKLKATPRIVLNGQCAQWCNKVKHLGNILSYNLDETVDVSHKRGDLASRVNKMLGSLGGASDDVLIKVFYSQCCHFYGTSAWRLNDRSVQQFHTMYNRCVRRVLELPYRTHTRFLPLLSGSANSQDQVVARFVKMLCTALDSDNSLIRYITNNGLIMATSIIGSNIDFISDKFSIQRREVRTYNYREHYKICVTQDDICSIKAIKELKVDNSFKDFYDFVNYLCVT